MTVVLAGVGVYATVEAQQSQEKTSVSKVRVGTFDSRALAFSYFGSEEFNHKLNDLRSELE